MIDLMVLDYVQKHRKAHPLWWAGRFVPIVKVLHGLAPDRPDDSIPGFVAYNVPDKGTRMKMKTGRFLTRKLNLNHDFLNDAQIRELAEKINLELFPDIETRLDTGRAIYDNYRDGVGGSSCMTGESADYVGLYCDNPSRFAQLIMTMGDDSARAMVHTLDNGKRLMDRIYATTTGLIESMRAYAIAQGWLYRETTSCSDYDVVGDDFSYDELVVSGLDWTECEVPYADTLRSYCIRADGLQIMHHRASVSSDGVMDRTDGCLEEQTCEHCDERIPEGEMWSDENGSGVYCADCFNELFTRCAYCGIHFPDDDIIFVENTSERVCPSCAEDRCIVQCDECRHYFEDEYHIVNGGVSCVCLTCAENGDYHQCEECEDWFSDADNLNENGRCSHCEAAGTGELFVEAEAENGV